MVTTTEGVVHDRAAHSSDWPRACRAPPPAREQPLVLGLGHRGDQRGRSDRPYFVLEGNICALQATKDHVNVFLYDPLVSDPAGIITSGHENTTGRTVAIYQGVPINEAALLALFQAIITHNKAGGWRKLSRRDSRPTQ